MRAPPQRRTPKAECPRPPFPPEVAVTLGPLLRAQPFPPAAEAAAAPGALRERAAGILRTTIRWSPLRRRMLWSLPAACGAVALTFDDGPNPEWTPRVLDILSAHQASASFF